MDHLRLAVAPTPADSGGGFHVEVYVNDAEVTSAGAGLGMDTYDLLIPENKLVATMEARRVPLARCDCGVYGCGVTDIVVQQIGDTVRWDWLVETPMNRSVEFDAGAYDQEVRRAAADHSWETPERRAGRLVLERADRERLADMGLQLTGAANNWNDPHVFFAWLSDPGRYQVAVAFDWADRDPSSLADEVCRVIAHERPDEWRAQCQAPLRSGDRRELHRSHHHTPRVPDPRARRPHRDRAPRAIHPRDGRHLRRFVTPT